MKKTNNIIGLISLMIFSLTSVGFAQQTIEGKSSKKYISLKRKTATTAAPVIQWTAPNTDYYTTTNKVQSLQVCITSKEKPSDIVLYVDRIRQNPRDFNIVPNTNRCDYTWKTTMNFGQIGKYFLEIEVTNSGGKTRKSCIIDIKSPNTTTTDNTTDNTKIPSNNGRRYALVIGNSRYKKSPLVNPTNDADDMSLRLKALGFTVDKHKNLNKRQTINAVNRFKNKIRKNDVALFFYAGHGYQINGISYLLPIGAVNNISSETDAEFEGYRVDRVLGNMQEAEASVNLVFLDACRNSPIRGFLGRTINGGRGLAFPQKQPQGSIIAFATAPGGTAEDGQGRNGTYTNALLNYLKKGESITDILTLVTGKVRRETESKQVPSYNSSLDNLFKF